MNVLMCCSDLSYKGGMVSVVRNYLDSDAWPADVAITFVPTHRQAGKAGLIWCFARAVARIARMARAGQIDVVHLHVAERGSFVRKGLLVKLLHRFGIPVVLHHHGAEFEEWYAARSPRVRRWIDSILAEADVNIVLSPRLIPMIKSKVPDAKVEAVYNAVATLPANPYLTESQGVLFLGRLGERKGTLDLLEAMRRIDGDIPPGVKFNLCGDGAVDEVRARVDALGLTGRVAHIGWTDGAQKEEILRSTMLNVLPSYNEGLPMTILETMARGIPNLSTPVASIPEVIADGETGLLVPPGDVGALASALRRLILDAGMRRRISDASFSLIAERFSLPVSVSRVAAIYRSLRP